MSDITIHARNEDGLTTIMIDDGETLTPILLDDDAIDELRAALETPSEAELQMEIDDMRMALALANRRAADHAYMLEAVVPMLGPKGRAVWDHWMAKGTLRVHFTWGPEGAKTSGEERAQIHLDWIEAEKTAVIVEDIDSDLPQREVREFIADIKDKSNAEE